MRILTVLLLVTAGCTVQLSPNESRFDDLTRRVSVLEATKADARLTVDAFNQLAHEVAKLAPTPAPLPTPPK